ncbi:response regulator [Dyella monticola]|uniref:Response regulator n=1 Tax=Dyella monticola TaxID=1927958 RepID=A0A370X320_9GAMM|nr:response regulator [Dyella monticola]RDS82814.1 response regulator [Dyella monticola]
MLRILLVEDDPDVAAVTRGMLEFCGYHVTVASNGRYGLDIIRQEQPELIVTDFMMPMMSGLEMIERAQEAGYEGPVILCSAVPESQFPPHRARYDAYLQKPYYVAALLDAVERMKDRGR